MQVTNSDVVAPPVAGNNSDVVAPPVAGNNSNVVTLLRGALRNDDGSDRDLLAAFPR